MTQLGEFNWLQYDPNSFLDRVRVTFRLMASRERVTPSRACAVPEEKSSEKSAAAHAALWSYASERTRDRQRDEQERRRERALKRWKTLKVDRSLLAVVVYVCVCTPIYKCTFIYIYIYRERERSAVGPLKSLARVGNLEAAHARDYPTTSLPLYIPLFFSLGAMRQVRHTNSIRNKDTGAEAVGYMVCMETKWKMRER